MSGYPNQLKYFMWEYQVHFRISCQVKANAVFDHFDRSLNPNIIMLGFQRDNVLDNNLICFEQETNEILQPILKNLKKKIAQIEDNDPQKNMFYSGYGIQEMMDIRRKNDYFRLAIEQLLNESEFGKEAIYFVSEHAAVNNHYVFIVLALHRETYTLHNLLKESLFNERYKIYTSILETSVLIYLQDCHTEILLPEPGHGRELTRSVFDIRRQAALQFMYTVASKGNDGMGLHGLFEACEIISVHRYEGEESMGLMYVSEENNPYLDFTLRFDEPFSLKDYRKTRKVLQLAKGEVGLICNSNLVLGIGKIRDDYNPSLESIFIIRFTGIHCWEVSQAEQLLLIMRYGEPYLAREIIIKDKFHNDCRRIFGSMQEGQLDNLFNLAVSATKQRKGALLIISGNPWDEANRLRKQCIPIEPVKVTPETLLTLTSIDGGVLMDINGTVYAQGVILDGIVTDKGDSARGSRYNSALTYYDFKRKHIPTLIIVISEDGMVDILPFLRPQIGKSEIPDMLLLLKKSRDENDLKSFNEIMDWLISMKFYLSPKQCSEVNAIKNEMQNRKTEGLRILHPDLIPNKEMDESYFLN